MVETKKVEIKEKERQVIELVVRELPKQDIRNYIGDEDTEYHLITIEEAIMDMRKDIKELKDKL